MLRHAPRDAEDVREIVADAVAHAQRLEIAGGGRCRSIGRPVEADALLDLKALSGVVLYEPHELVLSARAATPLAQIRALLAEQRQHLAFEPPDFGPLLGGAAGSGTLGGCLILGIGGARRATSGAPRDHFLGLKGVNGAAQHFAAGGRVVKNVTGFDLPKLFAGSMGTLGVLTEVTVKVMPRPQCSVTLGVAGLTAAQAMALLSTVAAAPTQVSGGAYLSERVMARPCNLQIADPQRSLTVLRLEGFAPSVEWSAQHLSTLCLASIAQPLRRLPDETSLGLWQQISAAGFFADGCDTPVWRVVVEPSEAAALLERISSDVAAQCYLDGFGGVLWAALPHCADGGESIVRGALREAAAVRGGSRSVPGHATLLRASPEVRARIAPFAPLGPGLAALTGRLKQQFDPAGIFNRGRMYPEL